jgi:heme A synthase
MDSRSMKAFTRFAWFMVGYNIFVILWGAVVRATGSGAGCGNHWPTCNGEIVPTPEAIETVIEFTHRLTSGVDGLLVIALVIWAFRLQPVQRFVRRMSVMSLIFIIIEGLLGAALVRFELVEDNASVARAVMIALHLINTLILLSFLTLTAWGAQRSRGKGEYSISAPGWLRASFFIAIVSFAVMSAAGAITALGDTLFLSGVISPDDAVRHFLIDLRVYHPVLAILVSVYLIGMAYYLQQKSDSRFVQSGASRVIVLIILQIILGFVNIALQAPVWMQVVHLLVADTIWIVLVVWTADALTQVESVADEPIDQALSAAT